MKFQSANKMQKAIETILESHKLLDAFKATEEFYVKISNDPFMPLTIEKHCTQITITHYYVQNGDLVPDPDMEFEMVNGEWLPVAIQHSSGAYFRAMEVRDGKRFVAPSQFRDQVWFANMWAKNLLEQGFAKGKVERVE